MPDPFPPDPPNPDELYVGYLPVPAGHRRFLRHIVPAALAIIAGTAIIWSHSHADPGSGRWHDSSKVKLRGTLYAHPYPMIATTDHQGKTQMTLLVESGKRGAAEHAALLDRHAVVAAGTLLERDGPRMLELSEGASSISPDSSNSTAVDAELRASDGQVTLRGEIVDSKCFLGAMKPGNGKTHKACATLCIRGGIPPALAVQEDNGGVTFYLLAAPDGGPVGEWIEPMVADSVELTGRLEQRGDLSILRIAPENAHRL
ncbi:MAG: hypothetical protein L6Q35_08115 [Phycisphaerales bacterium]|nr:hypothetical protein [Phycisphaerales bacterium]